MTRCALSFAALGAALVLLSGAPPAALANSKSWVSNNGNDANDCTLAHPCATFQRAQNATVPGGEIGVLTPGDYGTLGIVKSLHITNDGTGEATVLAPTTDGFSVIAGTGDIISLRGLVFDGQGNTQGTGGHGIVLLSGTALHVQNCVIKNFNFSAPFGLIFAPAGNGQLFVSDSLIVNNGGSSASGGILILPRGGHISVVLDRLHVENNVDGLKIDSSSFTGDAHVIVRDSMFSGNAGNGIHAVTASGKGPAFALVEHSSMVNNLQSGVLADGPGATVLLKDNTITRNGAGISAVNGGQLISYGNNTNNNNIGPEGAPTSSLSQM